MNRLFNQVPVSDDLPNRIMKRIQPTPSCHHWVGWLGSISVVMVFAIGLWVAQPSPPHINPAVYAVAGTAWWVSDPAHDMALLY